MSCVTGQRLKPLTCASVLYQGRLYGTQLDSILTQTRSSLFTGSTFKRFGCQPRARFQRCLFHCCFLFYFELAFDAASKITSATLDG
jgi:hypothetical protein